MLGIGGGAAAQEVEAEAAPGLRRIEVADRLLAAEGSRCHAIVIEKLAVADIGRVVFQRIDQLVTNAQEMLRSTSLQGADYIRAVRKARSEVAWGAKTMDAVRPVADWFAR